MSGEIKIIINFHRLHRQVNLSFLNIENLIPHSYNNSDNIKMIHIQRPSTSRFISLDLNLKLVIGQTY